MKRAQTLKKNIDDQEQIRETMTKLSDMHVKLEDDYKKITDQFKTQYEKIQKRYQELHTVMVSNMEETERGNQSVRELIDLHKHMENEYKDMMANYEKQHSEYKASLEERDERLQALEVQVKEQLDGVSQKMNSLQNPASPPNTARSRIDELAQPKFITPKKI